MSVSALDFGTTRTGQPVHLYRMVNVNGMEVDVTDIGASIVSVRIPTSDGNLVDVALGYDECVSYEHNGGALGGTVGRVCNRIAGATYTLDDRTAHLTANEGDSCLHGGRDMWYERLWDGAVIGRKGQRRKGSLADTATFGLFSEDLDQGFPGDVDVRVTYQLTDDNEIAITYDAQPTIETLINLTNHTYWNLNGHDSGSVLGHTLCVAADTYTPVDAKNIPTGEIATVEGTPFDFREPKTIGRDLTDEFGGYDHNFVIGNGRRKTHRAASLIGDLTGIRMDIFTELPDLQVYTGQGLDVLVGKDGASYGPFAGIALETQFAPDAIHHPNFAQPVFSPERPFQWRTVLRFSLT